MNPKRHILIVEDEEDIRDSLRDFFESEGHHVDLAANGRIALDLLISGLSPDLILLDLMMPVMGGAEFVAERNRLLISDRGSRTVVMSADSQTSSKAASMGVDGFLKKPIELEELLALVLESPSYGGSAVELAR